MDSEEIDKWDQESERAWKNDEHIVHFADSIVEVLKEILTPSAEVLDCGCGIGKHIRAFRELGYTTEGIDQSIKAVQYARKLNPDTLIIHARLQDLINFSPETYNLIHTCAVLQHSTHDKKRQILANFRHILKPSGFLLSAECTFTPETLKLLKEKNPSVEFTEEWTDGYSFSQQGWIRFMLENEFEHIKTIFPWPYYLFKVHK